jgi:hypothetical protein
MSSKVCLVFISKDGKNYKTTYQFLFSLKKEKKTTEFFFIYIKIQEKRKIIKNRRNKKN